MPTPPPPPRALYRSMAPPVAEAPAAAYPSSTGPATIELTINGALYRWTGTATFSGGLWNPPGAVWSGKWLLVTPAPTPAVVTGYVDSSGTPLTVVTAGAAFGIVGRGFGSAASQAWLDAGAGSAAPFPLPVTSWSDTRVLVTMPATGALPASATVTLQLTSGARLTGPVLTIVPAPTPIPAPTPAPAADPVINGFFGMTPGAAPATFAAGQTVKVMGAHFGPSPGQIQLQGGNVPALLWTDAEVDFVVPAGSPTSAVPVTVAVVRADGKTAYVSQGITIAQALLSPPPASNDSDPLPGPWAAEIPATVETSPFTVGGKSYALLLKLFAGAGPGSFTVNGRSVAVSITPVPVLLQTQPPASAGRGPRLPERTRPAAASVKEPSPAKASHAPPHGRR